jgi:hypothetical protein
MPDGDGRGSRVENKITEQAIKPEKITKPIQLLGAWLAGLLSVDGCFLIAAANLGAGSWESKALIVASIVNVPLFLVAVFILQTKFRPELQEDSFYSTYLSRKTNQIVHVSKDDQWTELFRRLSALEDRASVLPQVATLAQAVVPALPEERKPSSTLEDLNFSVNLHLPDGDKIAEALFKRGVPAVSEFGTNEAPEHRVVAISKHLPKRSVKEVIALARELDFDGYTMWDPREEDIEDDVLLGAYGELEMRFAKLLPTKKKSEVA